MTGSSETTPATRLVATPTPDASPGSQSADRQTVFEAHGVDAVGTIIPARQSRIDTPTCCAGGDHDSAATIFGTTPTSVSSLPSDEAAPQARGAAETNSDSLADPFLALAADVLDDLEKVRIANENRLRQLTRSTEDSDGEERGFGLDERHPDVARLAALVDMLGKAEHQAELNLKRQLRKHPLGPWVKAARGVGEKQAARLLAAIGDPYLRPELTYDDGTAEAARPRTVSELWAYAGYHVVPARQSALDTHGGRAGGAQLGSNPDHQGFDTQAVPVGVAAARARGQRANWSADAKMRAHLVAVSIVKAGGPYRAVYDQARVKYADASHQVECKRCGPSGKPAQPGTALSAGHQHARALRIVAKEVLKDLWREAKRLHETTPATTIVATPKGGSSPGSPDSGSSQAPPDTHGYNAAVQQTTPTANKEAMPRKRPPSGSNTTEAVA